MTAVSIRQPVTLIVQSRLAVTVYITPANEACDDAGESANCNADCSLAACGVGIVNARR